ncbi:MAG TPA: RNA methyltransferase [Bacteroidetes bacterium]|nr:RNA methyltransferase [Bacteroidota bacterium]
MRKLTHEELVTRRLSPEQASSAARHPIGVLLHDIRSLYNVGSIFRTCDAFRIDHVYLTGFTPRPPRTEISKTALGAELVVPHSYHPSAAELIGSLRDKGHCIAAAEITDDSRDADSLVATDFPMVIILGNELTGVPDELLGLCHMAIEIPMYGTKHSLNVSVAAGVLLAAITARYREESA